MHFPKRLHACRLACFHSACPRLTTKQAMGEHSDSTACQLQRGGVLSRSVSGKISYFKVCCKTYCCSLTALYIQYLSVLSPLTRVIAFLSWWISCHFRQLLFHQMVCVLHNLAAHLQAVKTCAGLVPVFPPSPKLLILPEGWTRRAFLNPK